ncbi:hypothetical protein ACQKNX_08155 [Lysinibacillus sp. NPDC093712]|uniref:hypothetical protein n=1 Tax=Lysinibacillus sp. NPDC093712 TaxID=3390579 RepID=UPI003CFD25C7
MSSYKNYSNKSRKIKDNNYNDFDNSASYDPAKLEEIDIEEWVKFISYYRYYVDEFAINILGLKLYPFQRVILRAMARHEESMFIASRGLGKSYLSAVFFICIAILYPSVKLGIASGKGQQSRNVIVQKVKGELYKNENVKREIENIKTGSDDCSVIFKNGSEIRAIVLGHDGENARSWRFSQILIDEARLVSDDIISEILVPMTKTRRNTVINLSMIYGDKLPIEKGKIIYISSAYLKTCNLYQRFMTHYDSMMKGSKEYFVCTLPYQVGVNAGIYYEDDILKEKSKPSMTSDKFAYEYEAVFVGNSNDSYYPYDLTESVRNLSKAEVRQPKKAINSYVISHDVAISDRPDSDNACTSVIKIKEKPNGSLVKELVYMKTHNGMSLPEQANYLRRLLLKYDNTIKLVIDVRGNGEALPSLLAETWEYTNDNGEVIEFPPLIPDGENAKRYSNIKNSVPLIREISATNQLNNSMYTYMKTCFEDKSIRLLVSSALVDSDYKQGKITDDEFSAHINTDLLVQEMSNIKQEISGHSNILYNRIAKGTKRDRVTSLGYGMYFIRELEIENKNKTDNVYEEDDDIVYY